MNHVSLNRREFLRLTGLGLATMALPRSLAWGAEAGAASAGRPNIVFILTDDQRIDDFGCYGNKQAITPNVDALAARGVRFTNAMVTCPVCGPSRVNLLTGRYLSRFLEAPFNEKCYFPSTQPTVASILKDAGYQTGIVGKMHFKVNDVRGIGGAKATVEQQFKAIGFTFAEQVHPYNANPGIHLNEQEKAFDAAIKFVNENKERPFALFVFTTLTHGPFEAPQKYQDMVKGKGGKIKDAMTTWLDSETGRLMSALDQAGVRDRTAIFYAADNAPATGGGDNNKSTCYDGRIAQIVSWPGGGVKQGVAVDSVTMNIDYLPTILEICGVAVPPAAKADGQSFLPLLTGKPYEARKVNFIEHACARAVRTDRWKYIALRDVKGYPVSRDKNYGGQTDLLFDLKADPDEKKNLFKDPAHAEILKELQALLSAHCATYDYPFGEFGGGKRVP
jgi:arylsulfatase A-like enzyme